MKSKENKICSPACCKIVLLTALQVFQHLVQSSEAYQNLTTETLKKINKQSSVVKFCYAFDDGTECQKTLGVANKQFLWQDGREFLFILFIFKYCYSSNNVQLLLRIGIQ